MPLSALDAHPKGPARARVGSIDLVRGIVMLIMMLDHTREFVHYTALQGLLLLYPLCKWFASVEARRRDWWYAAQLNLILRQQNRFSAALGT